MNRVSEKYRAPLGILTRRSTGSNSNNFYNRSTKKRGKRKEYKKLFKEIITIFPKVKDNMNPHTQGIQ